MKLQSITEALSRRDFLKHTGSALLTPRDLMSKLVVFDAQDLVRNVAIDSHMIEQIIEWMVNQEFGAGGKPPTLNKDVLTNGILAILTDDNPSKRAMGYIALSDADMIDEYTDGAYTAVLAKKAKAMGAESFMGDIINTNIHNSADYWNEWKYSWAQKNGMWMDLFNRIPSLSKYTTLINNLFTRPGSVVSILKRLGVDDKLVTDIGKIEHISLNFEKEKREKLKQQEQQKKPEKLEQYSVPDDYRLASPMHQPFESKLFTALQLI